MAILLIHQNIIELDVRDNCGRNSKRTRVALAAEDYASLRVFDQLLDTAVVVFVDYLRQL